MVLVTVSYVDVNIGMLRTTIHAHRSKNIIWNNRRCDLEDVEKQDQQVLETPPHAVGC